MKAAKEEMDITEEKARLDRKFALWVDRLRAVDQRDRLNDYSDILFALENGSELARKAARERAKEIVEEVKRNSEARDRLEALPVTEEVKSYWRRNIVRFRKEWQRYWYANTKTPQTNFSIYLAKKTPRPGVAPADTSTVDEVNRFRREEISAEIRSWQLPSAVEAFYLNDPDAYRLARNGYRSAKNEQGAEEVGSPITWLTSAADVCRLRLTEKVKAYWVKNIRLFRETQQAYETATQYANKRRAGSLVDWLEVVVVVGTNDHNKLEYWANHRSLFHETKALWDIAVKRWGLGQTGSLLSWLDAAEAESNQVLVTGMFSA